MTDKESWEEEIQNTIFPYLEPTHRAYLIATIRGQKQLSKTEGLERVEEKIDEEKGLVREYERNAIVADAVIKSLNKIREAIKVEN